MVYSTLPQHAWVRLLQRHYTVVVADDHDIVRKAVADVLLSQGGDSGLSFDIVAQAANGLDAIAEVKTHAPDLLILDISMPLANGIEIINDVRRWSPGTCIVVLTGVTASGLLAHAVEAGVQGLFSKTFSVDRLVKGLKLILAGGHYVDPDLVELIEQGNAIATLTDRERQTLNMIVTGKSNKEIARLLNISAKTVEKHRGSLMNKLGVRSVAELMARALKDGLIDPV
jgi:DNA-binding NarL/FixJ family response regulator